MLDIRDERISGKLPDIWTDYFLFIHTLKDSRYFSLFLKNIPLPNEHLLYNSLGMSVKLREVCYKLIAYIYIRLIFYAENRIYTVAKINSITKFFITIQLGLFRMSVYPSKRSYVCTSLNL